jgi:hypothetical protein
MGSAAQDSSASSGKRGRSGNGGGNNWDYCYDPIAAGETVLSGGNDGNAKNLKACIGECDNDGQCAAGLKCYQRKHGEHIPVSYNSTQTMLSMLPP